MTTRCVLIAVSLAFGILHSAASAQPFVISASRESRWTLQTGSVLHDRTLEYAVVVDSTGWIEGGRRRVFTRCTIAVVDFSGIVHDRYTHPVRDCAQEPDFFYDAFRALPAVTPGSWWRAVVQSATDRGTRTTTYLRDTLVAGEQYLILRDSTDMVRSATWPTLDFGGRDSTLHRQQLRGYIIGNLLYDPRRSLVIARSDTLRMQGELVREYAGNTRYKTRRSVVTAIDMRVDRPEVHAARVEQRNEEFRRTWRHFDFEPALPDELALAAGRESSVDSLIAVWSAAESDQEKRLIEHRLGRWYRNRARDWNRELFDTARRNGDAATAFRLAIATIEIATRAVDHELFEFLLPYMEDAGVALHAGLPSYSPHTLIMSVLMRSPPVLHNNLVHRPVCAPRTCALLETYATRADVDYRLRDLGVAAVFLRDPAAGFPALETRVRETPRSPLLTALYRTALGYRSDTPGATTVPPVGADIAMWVAYAGTGDMWRRNATALPLYQLRTGRNITGEMRARFDAATDNLELLVFGNVLNDMDPYAFNDLDVLKLLERRDQRLDRLAADIANRRRPVAMPAPDSIQSLVLDALIAELVDGKTVTWPGYKGSPRYTTPVRIISDGLPALILERWSERVTFVTRKDQARDGRAFVVSSAPQMAGPFVYFTKGGSMYTLMRTPAGWRVVSLITVVP